MTASLGLENLRQIQSFRACFRLFIVSPHSKNSNNLLLLEYFVDNSVLNVDSTRIATLELTDERFVSWRSLEGIIFEEFEDGEGFIF